MKILYSAISLISGLVVLDSLLSFFGISFLFGGLGMFGQSNTWYLPVIGSLIVFGLSTAMLFKKKGSAARGSQIYIFLVGIGIALALGALPAGFMLELTVNGCCGAPSNGHEKIGLYFGGSMVVGGAGAIIYGVKKNRQVTRR